MSTLTTPVKIAVKTLAIPIRQKKELKEMFIGQETVKLTLFTDNTVFYINDLKFPLKYT